MSPAEVIAKAVQDGSCEVPMGYALSWQVDQKRQALHAAALQQLVPIEIVTLPMGIVGQVGLLVRRFKLACPRSGCSITTPHTHDPGRPDDCCVKERP